MPLPSRLGQRRVVMKDHPGAANANLITIVESRGTVRDEPRALHVNAIRGLEIFDNEGGSASQDTRVVATDTGVGQAEKTLRMPSEHRDVGKQILFPTVESLEHV
jgi:hypothetical protein